MKFRAIALLPLIFALCFSAAAASPSPCTLEVEVTNVIGPASVDLIQRVQARAVQDSCSSILLLVNTPGGSLESTRLLVEQILNSPVPYLCLVSPSGGHAGSAGAILLQACHVNGGLAGTNLGAATPVAMGQELPKDLREKIVNDTRSWMESLTRLRGRNEKFGADIILEAKAVTSEEALRLKALDFAGPSKEKFLEFASGRTVKVKSEVAAEVQIGQLQRFELDFRYKLLAILTDPELAYMMLLASLALLYFEITHAGSILPGVVGAIGLIVALVAMHRMDVEWGGLALIFVGIALLIAEMFLPAFGVAGVGGFVAVVLGSVFLFDPVKSFGYRLPLTFLAPVLGFFALIMVGVSILCLRAMRAQKVGGFDDLKDFDARVSTVDKDGHSGQLEVRGELWRFQSDGEQQFTIGDRVRIESHNGLVLKVKKEN